MPVAGEPVMIAVDWGTSSFRASLVAADGTTGERIDVAEGIRAVPDRDFEGAFARLLGPWLERSLPVVLSGMITSRNGWVETPYLPVPAGAAELAGALASREVNGRAIRFVTGVCDDRPGRGPEIMRGEETEIVGALAAGAGDGVFVLPGTHCKWAAVVAGRITGFSTYMTGELHAALTGHTILGALMRPGPFAEGAFRRGVAAGLEAGTGLTGRLFQVRTLSLFGRLEPEEAPDFLSGLLIGAEVRDALPDAGASVSLIGRGALASRYAIAIESAGRRSRGIAGDLAARGALAIARLAGLVK